jgi:hypothetical protein
MSVFLKREATIKLEAQDVAELFCDLDDDSQAQFFVHVAATMKAWPEPGAGEMQKWYIGRHLAQCDCVTEDAREWIADLAETIQHHLRKKSA